MFQSTYQGPVDEQKITYEDCLSDPIILKNVKQEFTKDIAKALGVNESDVIITMISKGSIIVSYVIKWANS